MDRVKESRMTVHLDETPVYDIVLSESFYELENELIKLGCENRKLCIVTDTNVAGYYLEEVEKIVSKCCRKVTSYVFPAGEENKNLETVQGIYEHLIKEKYDRKDYLIALGGGVVGDLCGFAAATYLRGIGFIQIPTTLLAQVDSSIGGKTGVDFRGYKNMVGAFYMPSLVYVNISALNTLDARQLSSGMGEIIKHSLIRDNIYYRQLEENAGKIMHLESDVVTEVVFRSQEIKKQVVENDPKEKGERAHLNFGHTIGHAIEKALNFSLLHGECVALGMVAAAYISVLRGNLFKTDICSIEALIASYGLPVRFNDLNNDEIIENCFHDKKKEGNSIRFVLLKSIGCCYTTLDVSKEEMNAAINYLKGELC